MIAQVAARLRSRIIDDPCMPDSGPLMIRYFLLQTKWLGIYLHHFRRSDHDRFVHDHPWDFLTFLLTGGYREHTPAGVFWRRRFSLLWRPAEWRHWVELDHPVWTLVFRFRRRRQWGFHTDHGWVDWKTYDLERCD